MKCLWNAIFANLNDCAVRRLEILSYSIYFIISTVTSSVILWKFWPYFCNHVLKIKKKLDCIVVKMWKLYVKNLMATTCIGARKFIDSVEFFTKIRVILTYAIFFLKVILNIFTYIHFISDIFTVWKTQAANFGRHICQSCKITIKQKESQELQVNKYFENNSNIWEVTCVDMCVDGTENQIISNCRFRTISVLKLIVSVTFMDVFWFWYVLKSFLWSKEII